jgi:hypothetical protein
MEVFLQHVGKLNVTHIQDTVTSRRSVEELLKKLSISAPERGFFENIQQFRSKFSDGHFNCWACPSRAEVRFKETNIGDLVLIVPTLGDNDGGVYYLGIVKAKCPVRAYEASQILWPDSGDPDHLYPFLFFFDTEVGFRPWSKFLEDLNYNAKFNPRGYYLRLKPERFERFDGPEGYLQFLRSNCHFRPAFAETEVRMPETISSAAIPTRVIKETASNLESEIQLAIDLAEPTIPGRSKVEISRIIRDSVLTRRLKTLYNNLCQICGQTIQLPDGRTYSEAHHIKPLGGDHKGPDIAENILILCPNHHAECDLGAIKLDSSQIRFHREHKVGTEYITYHNDYIYRAKWSSLMK